ncbi:MAG: SDR family oxidoreductase [Anaerolineales bacterium]|jgi:NAD(P)-dependent dehydrogenase (short-subunit alcohol dehydrogenase family)
MEIGNKSIIITGSSYGIGWTLTRDLARQGAQVACVARSKERLAELVRQIEVEGGIALPVPTDVTDRDQVEEMASQVITAFGQVDVLINNAAVFRAIGGFWEVDASEWWFDVTTNLLGSFQCCRAVLPNMMNRDEGIIINMTGGGFDRPNLGGSGYGSSKAAIMRMTDTLAYELIHADHNIQVYALNPGFVRSEMTRLLAETEAGQRWLPHVKTGLEAEQDHPAEDVSRAVIKLMEISCPPLSGRIFSYQDDFDRIAQRAEEIKRKDIYQLRMVTG